MPMIGFRFPKVCSSMIGLLPFDTNLCATRNRKRCLGIEQPDFLDIDVQSLNDSYRRALVSIKTRRQLLTSEALNRQHENNFCAERFECHDFTFDRLPAWVGGLLVHVLRSDSEDDRVADQRPATLEID